MSDGFEFDWSGFNEAFVQRAASTDKPAAEVMLQQARGIFGTYFEITPPASVTRARGDTDWNVVIGHDAKVKGENKVAADIRALYGTAGDAYDHLHRVSPAKASAFYFLSKRRRIEDANRILRGEFGSGFAPFDGGALHKKWFKGSSRRRADGGPTYYVADERELKKYIEEIQDHVGWLLGGHHAIADHLGLQLPAWAKKGAPSAANVSFTPDRLSITAINEVDYGSYVNLEGRAQWAINRQAEKMQRQWEHFIETRFGGAGLKVVAA